MIPERENWIGGLLSANEVWYADCSKTETGTRAGVFERIKDTLISQLIVRQIHHSF